MAGEEVGCLEVSTTTIEPGDDIDEEKEEKEEEDDDGKMELDEGGTTVATSDNNKNDVNIAIEEKVKVDEEETVELQNYQALDRGFFGRFEVPSVVGFGNPRFIRPDAKTYGRRKKKTRNRERNASTRGRKAGIEQNQRRWAHMADV